MFAGLFEFANAEISKPVNLALFAVMLESDGAAGIHTVVDVGGHDAVDLDLKVISFASDAVGVPVGSAEGGAQAFGEGLLAFWVALNGADKPHTAAFIVEAARPVARGAIDLCLVAEDLVGLDVCAEHESAVGLSFGEQHVAFEYKISEALFCHQKELLFGLESDLSILHENLAPGVRVLPPCGRLSIKQRHHGFRIGRGLQSTGEGEKKTGECRKMESSEHGFRLSLSKPVEQGSRRSLSADLEPLIPMNPTCLSAAMLWLGLAASLVVETAAPPCAFASGALERLPRENLLLWREPTGGIQTVRTAEEWEARRKEIVRGFESVLGAFPAERRRCELQVSVEEEVDCGSYVRRKISYQSDPGSRTPAFLCIPKRVLESGGRAPAVLCLHPTDDQVGCGVVVGLGGKGNRQYASELAEQGFVTLSPNYPLLAGYQPDLDALGYTSGTMKAIRDNQRGLDYLDTLPFVKPGGYAAIGHSLGGHNSVFTALFDSRVQVVVSSCGLDSFLDYKGGKPEMWAPGKGWCQKRYMPRLAEFSGRLPEIPFDFHELLGALAPRTVFISAPTGDSNFRWESVDRVGAAARPIFELLGRAEALRIEHPDAPHDFPDTTRAAAYEFIKAGLESGFSVGGVGEKP